MTGYNKKKLAGIIYLVAIYIVAILIVGNCLAFSYATLISQVLDQPMFEQVTAETDDDFDSAYYKSEYSDFDELIADQTEYAYRVQAEGSVLLQNAGLPLDDDSLAVTLLGIGSTRNYFMAGGGGSGAVNTSRAQPIEDSFTAAGFNVNPTAVSYYNSIDVEPSAAELPANVRSSFAQYNDAAIVFISRAGAESYDLAAGDLEFSEAELSIIDLAIDEFDNVVVLLNTMNPMELGYLEDKDVSVLWIGGTGEVMIGSVPEILTGERYPSGKLVDTYAYDSTSAPSMQSFSPAAVNNVPEDAVGGYYVNYAEGIYVGYRYYETRYADVVTQRENAGQFDYDSTVQYPFGYGLSYTEFTYSNFSLRDNGSSMTLSVDVTNSGDYVGKEAVQFYMQSPYTQYDIDNGIEKSAVELVGFGKTAELAPGESDTVTAIVEKEDMRVYDAAGYKTYIVEAGDYYFAAGENAHAALNNILQAQQYEAGGNAALADVYTQRELDTETYSYGAEGEKITNQFEEANMNYWYDDGTYLSRSNWTGTMPEAIEPITATAEMLEGLNPEAQDDPDAVMPVTGAEGSLSLASMLYWEDGEIHVLDYDNELWDDLLDQMTAQEMMDLFALGGYGTLYVQSVNKPGSTDSDGPAGFGGIIMGGLNTFGYFTEILLGSTWNVELAAEMGSFVGEDSLFSGNNAWYAPAVNIHRTPYSGRNFEYYSEDPMLSGAMASAVTNAAQAKGVLCYVKHFALNDQETYRSQLITFADEQTIREIYLRPFEDAVTDGGAMGLMNAMNRIGITWAGSHYNLQVNVVRNEWGFEGVIITDATTSQTAKNEPTRALLAGTDLFLCTNRGIFEIPGFSSNATVMTALRESAHRVLYAYAQCNVMNGVTADTKIVPVTPPWQIALIVADGIIGAAIIVGVVFTTRMLVKESKKIKEAK